MGSNTEGAKFMMKSIQAGVLSSLFVIAAQVAYADVTAYPSKGQSAEKQEKDKYECFKWAKEQTGFDPQHAAEAGQAASTPEQRKGGAARGAAKGAAVGAVGGAIGGDTGKGAAIGAGVGAAGGAARRRSAEREAAEQGKQAQAELAQQQGAFDNAQAACLKGRGYSVS